MEIEERKVPFSQLESDFFQAVEKEGLDNYAHLLPVFKIGEEVMSTELHFQLAPMYYFAQPATAVYMLARQTGKTSGFTAQALLRGHYQKGFHTLVIEPRADQLKRYNQTILRPMLRDCLLGEQLISRGETGNFFVKELASGSLIYLEFAYLSPDRVRGISGIASTTYDECQDLDFDFVHVIDECMSASRRFGFRQFTGTPKTSDCTLAVMWGDSSMAEWVIPCTHCSRLNVPSIDQDLIAMIGKRSLACAKCGKRIDSRDGHYEHARPDRRSVHAGYHLSQVVHPLHYGIPVKWQALLRKMEGRTAYSKSKFYNEVLGIPCDESIKLLSQEDLIAAATKRPNTLEAALKIRNQYEGTVLGIDWSGGGEMESSFTAFAVVGFRPGTDIVDCLYGGRLPLDMNPDEESVFLLDLARKLNCAYVAHDFGGAGYIRESMMRQAGLPAHQIVPFTYVCSNHVDVIVYNPPAGSSQRYSYSIDKARSLAILCAMLRNKKVTLPRYTDESRRVFDDLLALIEIPRELPHGSTVYLIGRAPKKPDDFAHALNYACSAIWYTRQQYPTLSEVAGRYRVSGEQLEQANPTKLNW